MNMKTRCVIFAVVLIAGMFLVGCGPIPAGAEIKANPDGTSAQVEFAGIVDSIAADLWVVAGQALVISPVTILDPSILTGDMVKEQLQQTGLGFTLPNIRHYRTPLTQVMTWQPNL
jgi:hypothetical protein